MHFEIVWSRKHVLLLSILFNSCTLFFLAENVEEEPKSRAPTRPALPSARATAAWIVVSHKDAERVFFEAGKCAQ